MDMFSHQFIFHRNSYCISTLKIILKLSKEKKKENYFVQNLFS